jgi:hypothetical protein
MKPCNNGMVGLIDILPNQKGYQDTEYNDASQDFKIGV